MPKKLKTYPTAAQKAETETLIENLIDDLCANGDRYIHADDGAYTVRLVETMNKERALWASAYFDQIVSRLGGVAEYRSTLNPQVFEVRSYLPRLIQLALEADEQIREMQDVKRIAFAETQTRHQGIGNYDLDSDIPF